MREESDGGGRGKEGFGVGGRGAQIEHVRLSFSSISGVCLYDGWPARVLPLSYCVMGVPFFNTGLY